jgi:hypothetical protein
MTREQAVEILENMPEDIYTLDGISTTKVESWSLARLHKQFIYKGNNQNISIDCIVDWREETFNLVHVIHNPKQELPFVYSKVGEKMVAYFTLFGLKRDFYL